MKHYWINIDKNEKRRNFMKEQFEKNNIENVRISAITPNDFDNVLEQKRPLTCKYPGCTTCEYEFACLCSHIKALQEGVKSNDDFFVVIEDDIKIPFVIDYDNLTKNIPQNAEIIQLLILYGDTVSKFHTFYKNTGQLFVKWLYLLPSTGMYIISRKGALKLIEQFYNKNTNKYDFSSSPHQIVADVLLYSSVNTYATTLPYAVPFIEMGSEIHPEHLQNHAIAIKDIQAVIDDEKTKYPFVITKTL